MVAVRDKDRTRQRVLDAAFHEFWTRGYNAARVDDIIAQTGFTKGAFYHHFPSKKALACAVIDEVLGGMIEERWVAPLAGSADPLTTLIERLQELAIAGGPDGIRYGCPLNNMAQELSGVDEEIRLHTSRLFDDWISAFAAALKQGQTQGTLRQDFDSKQVATFVIASFEGATSLAKSARSAEPLEQVLSTVVPYLETLRVA